MKIKLCIFLGIFVLSSISFAGGREAGNGGNIVVCKNSDGSLKSVELLDYYEARTMRMLTLDYAGGGSDVPGILSQLLSRLALLSPDRAVSYQTELDNFNSNALFVPAVNFVPVLDSENIFVPDGCDVVQTIVQRTPQFPTDKRYYVNQDIWNLLPDIQKAGLMLHEVIYKEAISEGATNSIAVRYLNSLIASPSFLSLTFQQFSQILQNNQFVPQVEFDGMEISVRSGDITFFPNGNPQASRLTTNGSYLWKLGATSMNLPVSPLDEDGVFPIQFYESGILKTVALANSVTVPTGKGQITIQGDTSFYEDGSIQSAHLGALATWSVAGTSVTVGYEVQAYGDWEVVNLYEDGSLQNVVYTNGSPIEWYSYQFNIQNQNVSFLINSGTYLSFYADGKLQMGILDGDVSLKASDSTMVALHSGQSVYFDQNGLVLKSN